MNYYKRLDKEKRKELKKEFLSVEDSTVYKKCNKIFIISILGIVLSLIAGAFDFIFKNGVLNYIVDGVLLVFCIVILFLMNSSKSKEINKYALKKKKTK